MRQGLQGSMIGTALVAVLVFLPDGAVAQVSTTAAKPWTGPRTPDGQPDVQGSWGVPGGALYILENIEEGSDPLHSKIRGQQVRESRIIVDPPDGRIPYTPSAATQRRVNLDNQHHPDPKLRDPVSSCRLPGVPRMLYQGGVRIVQTPGYVALFADPMHTYRIIPIDGRPHLGENIKLWMGDSRGRWEGDTLIVDVTNSNGKNFLDWSGNVISDALHVVERWTFQGDTLNYEATLEDSKAYTRPWKMALALTRSKEDSDLFEEACYEGISQSPGFN